MWEGEKIQLEEKSCFGGKNSGDQRGVNEQQYTHGENSQEEFTTVFHTKAYWSSHKVKRCEEERKKVQGQKRRGQSVRSSRRVRHHDIDQ